MNWNKVLFIIGCVVLGFFAICAIIPDVIAPYALKEMDAAWMPISSSHILGTNDMGYDIFTELVYSTRSTLFVGIVAAFISVVLGTIIGLFAGYSSSIKSEVVNGVIQTFLMIPLLPVAIVVAAFAGKTILNITLIIALLGWCGTARTVRSRTLQLKQTGFVESLTILGISNKQIMFKHILPNLSEVITSRYLMTVGSCMMTEATLSFLGLGTTTDVTWGRMINLAYSCGGFTKGAYNWLISPAICILLIIIALYCISSYVDFRRKQVSVNRSYLE